MCKLMKCGIILALSKYTVICSVCGFGSVFMSG